MVEIIWPLCTTNEQNNINLFTVKSSHLSPTFQMLLFTAILNLLLAISSCFFENLECITPLNGYIYKIRYNVTFVLILVDRSFFLYHVWYFWFRGSWEKLSFRIQLYILWPALSELWLMRVCPPEVPLLLSYLKLIQSPISPSVHNMYKTSFLTRRNAKHSTKQLPFASN